jgi:hypothetical protein
MIKASSILGKCGQSIDRDKGKYLARGTAEKISISLFPADIEKIKKIREFAIKERGIFINRSQAFRLALKYAPTSAEMLLALEEVLQEESRKS